MTPAPTARLRLREMADGDLDDIAALLGDPEVMRYYPAPRSREQAQRWIDWSRQGYAEHGHALWAVHTLDGEFVGDCGLTWQPVNGVQRLEVGYHVRPAMQGLGYAGEAAAACVDFARDVLQAPELVSISHPDNVASQRVAHKVGLRRVEDHLGPPAGTYTVYAIQWK